MVAWDLARELVRQGHEVVILTTPAPKLVGESVIDGVTVRVLDCPSGRYSRRWWNESSRLFKESYQHWSDLVLGIGGGAHAIVDVCRRSGFRVPVIIQSHGTPWGEILSKLQTPSIRGLAGAARNLQFLVRDWRLSHYSHIIAIGPAVAEALERPPMKWLKRSTPLGIIENGIDLSAFSYDPVARVSVRHRLGLNDNTKVAISVSRLTDQKGVREGLLGFASAQVHYTNSAFLILGEGPMLAQLKVLAEQLGVQDRVFFLGSVPRSELCSYLSAADVFVFTTLRQEGLAIAPLEAAGNGLRLVLSAHVVPVGIDALAVDPRSPKVVADAILTAFRSPPGFRECRVPEMYSLSYSSCRYLEIFQKLIA